MRTSKCIFYFNPSVRKFESYLTKKKESKPEINILDQIYHLGWADNNTLLSFRISVFFIGGAPVGCLDKISMSYIRAVPSCGEITVSMWSIHCSEQYDHGQSVSTARNSSSRTCSYLSILFPYDKCLSTK